MIPSWSRAQVDLVLGEDHPFGRLAAKLAPVERHPVRERCTRQRDRDLRAGPEVPGAADDLERPLFADVDLRELEPVGVRMLAGFEHMPDAEERQVARDAAPLDPVHLGSHDRKPRGDLVGRRVGAHVLAQP